MIRMSCKSVRLAVLGAPGVGKSAMVVRFITGRFLHHYDPTLEDEYRVETEVEGQPCSVSILDTAGLGENTCTSSNYLSSVDAVLVVFSLANQSSLETAKQLLQITRTQSIPSVLVGTKCDLRTNQRVLSYDNALSLAKEHSSTYMETSSAVNINVMEAFHTAIGMVIMQQQHSVAVKVSKTVKKNSARKKVRGIWAKLTSFRKEKKLLDSLAVSPNSIDVDIMTMSLASPH